MEKQLIVALSKFLDSFEQVFDKDWDYTKQQLGIADETEEQKENLKKIGLDNIIYVIAPSGTFLNPNVDDDDLEAVNWGNRMALLKDYKELKKFLVKQVI